MSFFKAVLGTLALAIAVSSPAFATSTPSPKPMKPGPAATATAKATHMCRNAKGQFVKGKYVRCPNGTHAA